MQSTGERVPDIFDAFLFAAEVSHSVHSKHVWKESYQETQTIQDFTPTTKNTHEIFTYLSEHLKDEIDFLHEQSCCGHCGEIYRRWENIGTHHCSYHPQPGPYATTLCCGRTRGAAGCQPCDHSPVTLSVANRWTHDNLHFNVPLYLSSVFRIPHTSIVSRVIDETHPAKSYISVRRVAARVGASWTPCSINIAFNTPLYQPVLS